MAEVDDPPGNPGAPIGDSNRHALAGSWIADHHPGAKGQGAMCSRHGIRVKPGTAGRAPTTEFTAVVTRDAMLLPHYPGGSGHIARLGLCLGIERPGLRGLKQGAQHENCIRQCAGNQRSHGMSSLQTGTIL